MSFRGGKVVEVRALEVVGEGAEVRTKTGSTDIRDRQGMQR